MESLNLDIKTRTANKEDDSKYTVTGILSTKEIDDVKLRGYQTNVILDLSKEATNRLREVSPINRFEDIKNLSELMEKTTIQYLNMEEVETILAKLCTFYPDMVTVIELPEKTHERRTSHAGTGSRCQK